MGKASQELVNMLTEFLICEIGSKAMDGITYALVLSNSKDLKKFMDIRKEANKFGYASDEAFRVYQVANGYIFDMDISVAKKITYELSKAVNKTNGGQSPIGDLIGDAPERRRNADMLGLAKYAQREFEAGNRIIEIALFNRNATSRIMVTGVGPQNEMLTIKYRGYAIRHWDIEAINANLLIPEGIRISKLEPCEILPSRTGVRFRVYLESISNYL